MTIADAIIEFEKQLHSAVVVLDSGFGSRPGENDRIYRKRKELAEIALQALRAQMEEEKNEPLTLDELQEMDGEPVWVTNLHNPAIDCWGYMDDGLFIGYFANYDVEDYGKKWLAYRHKPKEATP